MRAQSWKRVAWSQLDSRGSKAILRNLQDMRLEPRVTGPQHIADVREFLDKHVEWPVLDDATKQPGLPWRSRMGRVRPSSDLHPGKRGFDPREISRDIPTPDGTAQALSLGDATHVAVYDKGTAGQDEKLVGTIVYSVVDQEGGPPVGVLRAIATAPSHRRRTVASLLTLGMIEDMRMKNCEECYGHVPSEDVRGKPWLLTWMDTVGFEKEGAQTREGITVVNREALAAEDFVVSRFEGDEE